MTKALAVANQCYVLTANGADDNMAKGSGIITPWEMNTEMTQKIKLSMRCNFQRLKIRKYIDIGLKKNE